MALDQTMQEIVIIAGPNGAGKTSFANQYLPAADNALVFVNADEIARDMADAELSNAAVDLRAAGEMLRRASCRRMVCLG